MSGLTLYRIDPEKHMHRFYRLDVQRDLFGAWCLMRECGRIGNGGQTCSLPFPSPHQAEAALESYRLLKEKRGYAAK